MLEEDYPPETELTIAEAAEYLGRKAATVRGYIRSKALKPSRTVTGRGRGGLHYRVTAAELDAFKEKRGMRWA